MNDWTNPSWAEWEAWTDHAKTAYARWVKDKKLAFKDKAVEKAVYALHEAERAREFEAQRARAFGLDLEERLRAIERRLDSLETSIEGGDV